MATRIGYLLPTRESIMEGRPEAEPLLGLAERAERLGYDSVWVGDSLLARPRHEPITLLAGVAGRNPSDLEAAIYLTVAVDENAAKADERINSFLAAYYGQRPDVLKKRQACFAGSPDAAVDWINGYVRAGARYVVLRFAGDHERHLDLFAKLKDKLTA